MIESLERVFRATLPPRGLTSPAAVHICKLAHEPYPDPATALVFLLFEDDSPHPSAVAKVARSAAADAAVHAECRGIEVARSSLSGACRSVVPENLAAGVLNGRAYAMWTARPGRGEWHHTFTLGDARRAAPRLRAALDWAAQAAQATAGTAIAACEWLGAWDGVQTALATAGVTPALLAALHRRVAPAWDRPWPAALLHGDFFPGNVLFEGNRVTGVVDWGGAVARGPAFVDRLTYELAFALHLLGTGRRVRAEDLQAIAALPPFRRERTATTAAGVIATAPGSVPRLVAVVGGILRELQGGPARRKAAAAWIELAAVEATIDAGDA